jgi:hypothetical protein
MDCAMLNVAQSFLLFGAFAVLAGAFEVLGRSLDDRLRVRG